MHREIHECRLCHSSDLLTVLNLGNQALTGVFPKSKADLIPSSPLTLIKCIPCGLVQLKNSYEATELYGANYGYCSGLNSSMVQHLKNKAHVIQTLVKLEKNDCVIDIGSSDGTFLSFFPEDGLTLVGFDPCAEKFQNRYRLDINLVTNFFSAAQFQQVVGNKKAKVITSIAMFYDLEDPLNFAQQVASLLADEGVWHFEQSYLPSMLKTTAYDTVCHEHLEYYALKQIKWITDRIGLKIISIEKNNINGGSFAITAAKKSSAYPEATQEISTMLAEEVEMGLDEVATFIAFEGQVEAQRNALLDLLNQLKKDNKKVYGYGASTKGNVILQHCNIDSSLLPYIAEVNADKYGCYTPGTKIPICSESDVHAMQPDYLFVLPWHFKDNIIAREKEYLKRGGKLIFSLPELEIISE